MESPLSYGRNGFRKAFHGLGAVETLSPTRKAHFFRGCPENPTRWDFCELDTLLVPGKLT